MYILNQIDKLIMYTFESYNFLSGQTNKKSYRTLYMKGPLLRRIDRCMYLAPLQLTHGLSWTSGKVVRMKYPQHTGTSQHPLVGPGLYVAIATRCC